jgi:hypothetical protein
MGMAKSARKGVFVAHRAAAPERRMNSRFRLGSASRRYFPGHAQAA